MITRVLLIAGLLGVVAAPAVAQSDEPGIDVVVVSGSLDERRIDFITEAIEGSTAEVVVLQLDSSATLQEGIGELADLVEDPPVPVAVYAGPAPARVSGGALQLLAAARVAGAAPGVELGPAVPSIAGGEMDADDILERHPDLAEAVLMDTVVVTGDMDGFLDLVEPSIGQFVVGLDGLAAMANGEATTLSTAVEEVVDGASSVRPSLGVTFIEPGLIDTTLGLTTGPEVAFLFLVIGLSLAVFEFYAAGPGVAAGIALVCLLLGGYGVAVLPVAWWAVALLPAAILLYTVDFQRNDLGWKTIAGTAALTASGLGFTDAAPQITQSWWIVGIIVLGTVLWFGFALTTVVRARFSTQTIGRDHLIGRPGTAETTISPEGVVIVDDARWRARSTRASGIEPGHSVIVKGIDGIVLEVDPE